MRLFLFCYGLVQGWEIASNGLEYEEIHYEVATFSTDLFLSFHERGTFFGIINRYGHYKVQITFLEMVICSSLEFVSCHKGDWRLALTISRASLFLSSGLSKKW